MVNKWQNAIINECISKLDRDLTNHENVFITSRGGFIALEMIHDRIKALADSELITYLNSESRK